MEAKAVIGEAVSCAIAGYQATFKQITQKK